MMERLTLVGRAESDERPDVCVATELGQASHQEPALGQAHSVVASLQAGVPSHDLAASPHLLHHPTEDAVVLVRLQAVPQPDGDGVDVLREGGEKAGTAVGVVIEAVPTHHGGPQAGGEAGEEEPGQTVVKPHVGLELAHCTPPTTDRVSLTLSVCLSLSHIRGFRVT